MEARRGTLGKKGTAFASNDKPRTCRGRSNRGRTGTTNAKLPQIDKFLEHTLVSSISLSVPLTEREVEISQLVVSGKTNREMAQMLPVTESAVDYHRNWFMCKPSVHNVANLVKRAIAIGIA
ncbi:MAG TPA: response regulator transcription factor [Phycisphaerales bacterium]|nr:response regulator transcription factor [Phycisphaerales bacterium]